LIGTEIENPHFPLPLDYADLTRDGQRQARVAVVCKQETPEDLVTAWDFFRRYYLERTPPGFFYKRLLPSPKFHYQSVYDLGKYRQNLMAAPRGGAKSGVLATEVPLLMSIGNSHFATAICLATDSMVEERFATFQQQITENENIIEDFGLLKPVSRQGTGKIWNLHILKFTNGSVIRGFSVGGRKRGARPDLFILDDPEYDAANPVSAEKLRSQFETTLFRVILPMLEDGCAIFWVGTIIDRRSFLYWAFTSEDTRLQYWNRRLWAAARRDGDTFVDLLWPEKWNVDDLKRRQGEMGIANFNAEFLNDPVSDEDRILEIHPELSTYTVEGGIPLHPFSENDSPVVKYHMRERGSDEIVPQETTIGELVSSLYRMTFVDYAFSLDTTADYSCILVIGFDKQDILWVLDLWVGRTQLAPLHHLIWAMSQKWAVHSICPEAVMIQAALVENFKEKLEQQTAGQGWRPRGVYPVKYPAALKKEHRIATLQPRFDSHRIKIPANPEFRDRWPWSELHHQISDFTLSMAMLTHDDVVDTLAMHQYIGHHSGVSSNYEPTVPSLTTLVSEGHLYEPNSGIPYITAMTTQELASVVESIMLKKLEGQESYKHRRVSNRFDSRRPFLRGKR